MDWRLRFRHLSDRALGISIALILSVSVFAYAGMVWWAKPLLALLAALLCVSALFRSLESGVLCLFRSPLAALGAVALGLVVVQIAPLPGVIAGLLSPKSREFHNLGLTSSLARSDDPLVKLPEPAAGRSPAAFDRAASVRRLGGATVCLVLFLAVSRYVDRLRHMYLLLGALIAPFLILTVLSVVSLVSPWGDRAMSPGHSSGGGGAGLGPSYLDVLEAPGRYLMRRAIDSATGDPLPQGWLVPVPEPAFAIGMLADGPGVYLAYASFGLPLILSLVLHLAARKGSRLGLIDRLNENRQTSLVILMGVLAFAAAMLVGLFARPWLLVPYGVGVLIAVLPAARGAGSSGLAWTTLALVLVAFAGGALARFSLVRSADHPLSRPAEDLRAAAKEWKTAASMARENPLLGVGLGGFATCSPYYKTEAITSNNAQSAILQWIAETGLVGVFLMAVALYWSVKSLATAIARVGTAERHLAFGLIAAGSGLFAFSMVHWSIESIPVALAASALAGVWHRWSSGGTDLFVDSI